MIAERALLDTQNKAELFNMVGQLAQGEAACCVVFEVVKLKSLEIADEDETGQFVFIETGKVVERLLLCSR